MSRSIDQSSDSVGMHFREVSERSIGGDPGQRRLCPRDGQLLRADRVRGVEIDRCLACEGVFLDHLEFEALSGAEVTRKLALTMPIVPHSYAVYRCPGCRGDLMPRFCARGRDRYEIYFCGGCQGMWLDVGTLRRLRIPAAAGSKSVEGSEHFVVDRIHRAQEAPEATLTTGLEVEGGAATTAQNSPGDTASVRVGLPKNPREWFVALTGFPIDIGNPCTIFPLFTWLLIFANILVFAWPVLSGSDINALVSDFGLRPDAVRYDGEWYRIVTSMFLHGGIVHLSGNLVFFYVFGDNLEERYGSLKFVGLYLACGLIAGIASCLSAYSQGDDTIRIGASGAISGVLGAYLVTFPRTRILVGSLVLRFLPIVLRGPAWLFVIFWAGFNILGYVIEQARQIAMVDYAAHLGGFAAGIVVGVGLKAWRMAQDAEPRRLNES